MKFSEEPWRGGQREVGGWWGRVRRGAEKKKKRVNLRDQECRASSRASKRRGELELEDEPDEKCFFHEAFLLELFLYQLLIVFK